MIVGLAIAAILLLSGDQDRVPTVVIQSPPQDAQIAVGNEIILQASTAGAPDIIRLELAVDDVLVGTSVSPDSEGTGSLTISKPWSFGQAGPHVVSAVAFTASDETSARVKGKTWWQWTFGCATAVYHVIAPTRGKCVPTDFLGGVKPKMWLSDRLAAQLGHASA